MIPPAGPCASTSPCGACSATARPSWQRPGAPWSAGEPEYEQAYQEAARAHRVYGWEMPYVDDAGDEPGEGHPAGGESREADMIDTTGDTLAADTAEAEAMSQRFEEDERVWQGVHANDAAPLPEREDAERTRRRQLPLADSLREAIATSRTLLDHAEQT